MVSSCEELPRAWPRPPSPWPALHEDELEDEMEWTDWETPEERSARAHNRALTQTDRLKIQGRRYIRYFLECVESTTVEEWMQKVRDEADGRGWPAAAVEISRMVTA